MEDRDVVSWNVMIDGYTQHGRPNDAFVLFRKMLKANLKPNEVTLLAVLSACGQLGALESGRWVHSYLKNNGIEINVHVGTALIDMYSTCGSLEDARLVFDKIKNKDIIAWNSMIVGYAMNGFSQEALQLFSDMCGMLLHPTDITFIGLGFFRSMKDEFGIEPKIEHYRCMVNLLGRAGHLKEAYLLVKGMKIAPDPVLWETLLGACRLYGNIGLAEEIVRFLVDHNLANSGTYILLSNIYAATGRWDGVARTRTLMKDSGVQKEPGCSSIEVNNKTPKEQRNIYDDGGGKWGWLKAHGYTPQTDIVLHDIGEIEKEQSLEVHSKKFAIAFGLISTRPGTTIKIFKNHRVCSDCHVVTKLISKITDRRIVVRDQNRFHNFVDGSCLVVITGELYVSISPTRSNSS
ncbi:unnamed protein product [Ilex paraguariensis]|uniref:DYW domain-containing protein n=1 Tax=Ilex paraguariensis TaxID=185542 RepID=A0ABC8R2P7_9AQUA